MKRDDFTMNLDLGREIIIDNFAGGGGTSTGLEAAFGRPVDIAINHDPEALAMHALNHPYTQHYCESVWEIDPLKVTNNRPVGLVWLSPDCKHFSKAKGGTPVSKNIRGLAWVALRWAATTKPRVIALENVSELTTWGPLLLGEDGTYKPDPLKKGKTFESFLRQLRGHGYKVEWRILRACDNGAPTIRQRLFLIARRDGLPICWPAKTHGAPDSAEVIKGLVQPWRTAASCIDFELDSTSIFERKKSLVDNTLRRVAKGLWRHVLTSDKPYIVSKTAANDDSGEVLTPFINEHANASNQRTMAADEPLRTVCAQVKGGHFSMVAPTLLPMRGTSRAHLNNAHSVTQPLSTISAGGTHHALVAGHITKFNTGSVGYPLEHPMATITAGGTPKRPSTGITQGLVGAHLVTMGYGEREGQEARTQDVESPLGTVVAGGIKSALVAAHLVDMGHGESSKTGAKRWSHGVRDIETPLNTITASGGTSALTQAHLVASGIPADAIEAAFLEQANGGFYEGDGRSMEQPVSTITASGSNQRLITAYCVKYYSSGGQWQGLGEPMHTIPTKGRLGLVQAVQIPSDCLSRKSLARARKCAALLRKHLPEHFPKSFDVVVVGDYILVDITLRMLKPRELYRAQSFPATYQIEEIPDPKLLFVNGKQVPGDPRLRNKAHAAFLAEHGRRQRVFCSSLSDWLDNAVPIEWFIELLHTVRLTPNLDWLLLTKRIGNFQNRMREAKQAIDFDKQRDLWLFIKCWANGEAVPDHVYVGVTIANQAEAERDIPKLLTTPGAKHFLSMEPLLGPVVIRDHWLIHHHPGDAAVDWVISGGESGPGARPSHPMWHKSLRDQCVAAGVPYLFKQWGEWANAEAARLDLNTCYDTSRAGGWVEMDGFFSQGELASPGDSRAAHVFKIGKKAAGRLLDGRIWNQFPPQLQVASRDSRREVEALNG